MSTSENQRSVQGFTIAPLAKIAERNQVWSRMAAKYGVDNPVPPWKTSLDGICDALDQSACGPEILSFVDRRNEEDALSATAYSNLPYPENRLIALAHSLVMRGVIDEAELEERLAVVRARLES
ncbi:MAG TPA: thiocyanate hydrolase [Mycobacterium sp.]|nr:thiocyanate hydrolase [Mycobacterium sp.]